MKIECLTALYKTQDNTGRSYYLRHWHKDRGLCHENMFAISAGGTPEKCFINDNIPIKHRHFYKLRSLLAQKTD